MEEANVYSQTLHCIIANYIILHSYCIDIAELNISDHPEVQLKSTSRDKCHERKLSKL